MLIPGPWYCTISICLICCTLYVLRGNVRLPNCYHGYQMLLSAANCDVNVADSDQTTPLIMAAIQGNIDVCELLVSCPCIQFTG